MKAARFVGTAHEDLAAFPESARRRAGYELFMVQVGREPAELAEALRQWMAREGLTQAQAAKRLGVVQPRISEIARNKVDKLSLDYLVGLCAKAGVSVAVKLAA